MNQTSVSLAIKVERRTLAVALFSGRHLEYTQRREISSNGDKAEASAVGFVGWAISNFAVESAAVEGLPSDRPTRQASLTQAVIGVLRERGIPVWEVGKQQLFESFGVPPLRTRGELREVIRSIWPILPGQSTEAATLDATALGLYVQTVRLFSN